VEHALREKQIFINFLRTPSSWMRDGDPLGAGEHRMKKLKLEDLAVTSFDTIRGRTRERGTVRAHGPGTEVPFGTYDIVDCGDTRYFDCTYGCSQNTGCPNGCIEL
jgi:hypothetical protein